MKKIRILALCGALLIILALLSACSPKTPKTPEGFTAAMVEAGFEVADATDEFDWEGYANTVLIASNENYDIEYYALTDSEHGAAAYQSALSYYEEKYSVTSASMQINGINYNYRVFIADDQFHLLARIGHTLLRAECHPTYRGEVVDYAKMLGYR